MRTNIDILESLSINHKKLEEEKPFIFFKIIQAMDLAKAEKEVVTNIIEPMPSKKKYGWHDQNGFDDEPSGWMIEGGQVAYYEAIDAWSNSRVNGVVAEVEVVKGEDYNKLLLVRDLSKNLDDLFEIVKNKDSDSFQKMFGGDSKIISKRNFKAKLTIDFVD